MQRFITIIVGVIFLAAGVFMYFKNDTLVKNCTVETEATVIDMKEDFSADEDGTTYMYYPIIEYKVGEETITATMDSGSSSPAYRINEKITILYNPNNVKQFIVKDSKSLSILSYVFMAFGVLITGYGIKIALKKD